MSGRMTRRRNMTGIIERCVHGHLTSGSSVSIRVKCQDTQVSVDVVERRNMKCPAFCLITAFLLIIAITD